MPASIWPNFRNGQSLALSRCRSFDGIALGRPVYGTDIIFDKAIYDYVKVFAAVRAKPADAEGTVQPPSTRFTIVQAYAQKRRLRIDYQRPAFQGREPETTSREVDVYAIGQEYMDAFCHLRGDRRTFRLDRVLEAVVLDSTYQIPEDYAPSTWVSTGQGAVDTGK